jgi:class 3 adenylate cyclase
VQNESGAETLVEGGTVAATRVLQTLLFTDIVGSTQVVARVRDSAWRELLERHDTMVLERVREFGGQVNARTGDGFFIAFDSPGQAVRCAHALCTAITPLGLQLRAGIHTGECERTDSGLVGLAVHVAARIAALGRPDEVLVSGTVRELLAGSDVDFTDRGRHTLRGVPGEWQLFALQATAGGLPHAAPLESPGSADASARAPAPGAGFVGRRAELDELLAALARAQQGHGALFLLSGDAGIGKTRLAGELVARAQASGIRCVWSSAWDGGGAPAYWPWIQVVRRLVQDVPGEALTARLGSTAPYLAHIVPELGEVLPGLPELGGVESEQARFGLFDALTRFLHASAAEAPLVLVLDDLHAADRASLLLLEFLARTLHDAAILVVGAQRTGEEKEPESAVLLARLAAAATARTVPIGGLSRPELEELVAGRDPDRAEPAVIERLHELTDGNPFFADEVTRLLVAEQRAPAPGSARPPTLPLPDSVRDTIRRRLEPLPEESLDLLALAAVIGREFRLETLVAASEHTVDELLAMLDHAVAASTLREVPGEIGRYAFAHALIRETLYEDLPKTRRIQLHGTVAETLERLYGEQAELSELADHFFRAAPLRGADKALGYAVRAAERAMELLAYEHAEELYGYALRALDLLPADDERRCDLLLALGNAQMGAGDIAAARETLAAAAALARRLDLPQHFAQAALGSAPWGLSTTILLEDLAELLAEALGRLPADDTALRARVIAALAVALYWAAPAEARLAMAEEAIAMARRLDDPATLARVLADAHIATWDPESPERSLPWAEEILELSDRAGEVELALYAHDWRIALLLETGDVAAAERAIASFDRLASEADQPRTRNYARRHRTLQALTEGRYADAETLLTEAAATADLREGSIEAMGLSGQAFAMRWAQGRLGELEDAVRHFADRYPAMPSWRCALIAVYIDSGRVAEARREFERFASRDFADLPRDNLWLAGLVFLTEACARLQDERAAAVLERLLLPFADRNIVIPAGASFGPVARYLGLLAATRGAVDDARERFAAARQAAVRMSARPMIAQLCVDEARLLAATGAGESADAARLLAEAQTLASELGMAQLVAEVEALRGGAAGSAPEPPARRSKAELVREGDYWRVRLDDAGFMLKHGKGVHYLARLLAEPDTEIHALDLVGGPRERADGPSGDAGALLDPEAKAAYKGRLEDLREDLDEAEEWGDPERAAKAREEIEFLERELARAVGLGGRDRKAGSDSERARVNATRAIKAVIERIAGEHERLGRHLGNCVATGTFCVYRPEPGGPEWEVTA